jgi:hypothetical protein
VIRPSIAAALATLPLLASCVTIVGDEEDDDYVVTATTNVAVVEAEAMVLPTKGTVASDASASGGKAVILYNAGTMTATFSLAQAANAVSVVARGDACNGDPHMVVKVDGNQVIATNVVSGSSWSTYSGAGVLATGSHTLAITFDNDYYGGTGCDRNLRVDVTRVTYDDASGGGGTTAAAVLQADARVEAAAPTTNFGTQASLVSDTDPLTHSYLRFSVTGISSSVESARLRLFVTNGTGNGPALHVTSATWGETTITWNNKPAAGALVENMGAVAVNAVVEYDVTSVVRGNGTYAFVLVPDSSDGFAATAREGSPDPELVIVTGDGAATCGDTACDLGETCSTCATDCGVCPASCGDGTCADGETCSSCATDCGACPPPPAGGDIVVATVGDMNPEGNTSTSSPSGKNAAAIIAASPDIFLALGDFQYTTGSCSALVSGWDRLWAPIMPKTFHIGGPTHDCASATDELGYRSHFNGACAGQTSGKSGAVQLLGRSIGPHEYYSFDRGNWHFTMMPTTLFRYDTGKVAAATAWMDQDLAAARAAGKFLVVAWHDPYWTSSTSSHTSLTAAKPWIDLCDKHDVRILLSGSQHNIEIFHPQNANSTRNDATGTQQFQVSTGGIGLRSFTSTPANLMARDSATHGWLRLVLHADGSYDWKFNPVSGAFTHTGSRAKP